MDSRSILQVRGS
ncbi:hypothetical protein MTR67_039029 [Solanum verrucosum]|uniref:Uncharacterized protein n=1 Tax=Solanum verrucosum TaxID=315347 RepID=A0AAF0QBH1_SOLVR|nr:hypothetical protein MTR67_012530 [Solanum verrucosum]WMV24261.1 hypothetical protein MTR67_017646 [Solanum verrucosum]WMV45644.1 hypothetical protein MTR67_039029 [Solanum verrucosum]